MTFPFSLSHPALGCLFISIDSCSFRRLWSGGRSARHSGGMGWHMRGSSQQEQGKPRCREVHRARTERHMRQKNIHHPFLFFSLWEKKISISIQEEIRITCWTDNRLFCVCLLLIVCVCTGDYFGDLCAFMHVSAPPAVPLI